MTFSLRCRDPCKVPHACNRSDFRSDSRPCEGVCASRSLLLQQTVYKTFHFHAGCQIPRNKGAAGNESAEERDRMRRRKASINVKVGVACNSASMGFAFLHGGMKRPECIILRQGQNEEGHRYSYDTFSCFGSHHSWEVPV